MSQAFYDLYQRIRPELEVLEQERQSVLTRAKRTYITALAIGGIAALCIMILGTSGISIIIGIIVLAVAALAAYGLVNERFLSYKKQFKHTVITKLISLYDGEISYAPEAGISKSEFHDSGLFKTFPDRYHSEDLLAGKLGETHFYCSEVHAEERRSRKDSKGKTETYYVDIFKGIFFKADFNKDFHGTTFVLPDATRTKAGGIFQGLQRLGGNLQSRGELVMLEDPEFERFFVVYSDNQTTARYLLSTSLMARLVDLRKAHGNDIAIAFSQGKFMIARYHNQNLLEPSLHQSLLSLENIKAYSDDLDLMLGMVASLNLNNHLWSQTSL